jgi:thiamine pyrophosphate-dependent acetolactate synthase large subunit-like protein
MAHTASDLFLERLIEWGVDTLFGLPGDGINGLMEACARARTGCAASASATRKSARWPPSATRG